MSEETSKADLTETATAQIDLAHETDARLDKNDQDWTEERRNLYDTPTQAPAPSPGFAANQSRDLKAEYDAGITRYEANKDLINHDARLDRETIRENGTTLQSEFSNANTSQLGFDFQQASQNQNSINNEFNVQANQGLNQSQGMDQGSNTQSQDRSR